MSPATRGARRHGRMLAIVLALVFSQAGSCLRIVGSHAPFTPDQAAWEYRSRLDSLESFAFDLRYHTDVPFLISATFDGARLSSDREVWRGSWRRNSEVTNVVTRAAGPVQYEREGSAWRRSPRGVETRILDQLDQVVRGARLRYKRSERGRHVYDFAPEIPILDPTQSRKLTGLVEIDALTALPVRVWAADSTGSAAWELKLSRFNSRLRIELPFQAVQTVEAKARHGVSSREWRSVLAVIERRLDASAAESRVRGGRGRLQIEVDRKFSPGQWDFLLSRGAVELWDGEMVASPSAGDSATIVRVGGDAARFFRLSRLVARGTALAATAVVDMPVDPRLEIVVRDRRDELPSPDRAYALLMDGRVLASAGPGSEGRMLFRDLGGTETVQVLAAVVNSGMASTGFERIALR